MVGLSADTPLLARVNGVNKMVYIGELYSMTKFNGVRIEILGFDLDSLTLKFIDLKGVRRYQVDKVLSLEFSGGSLQVSEHQGVYVIGSYGELRVKPSHMLSSRDTLVSLVRGVFDTRRDKFSYLKRMGKIVEGELEGVICNSHEWCDLSLSKLRIFDILWWVNEGREKYGMSSRGSRIIRDRVVHCYEDPLKAYEKAWITRLQGLPSNVIKGGKRVCVAVIHGNERSRDHVEKLPLEPFLKLKGVLKKSKQVEAIRHIMGHTRMRFVSKRVATVAIIYLLCGGFPKGSEGMPGFVLENLANLVFSDLVATRLAEARSSGSKAIVYSVELKDGNNMFAGPIPILVSSGD